AHVLRATAKHDPHAGPRRRVTDTRTGMTSRRHDFGGTASGPDGDEHVIAAMRHALSLATRGPAWGVNPQVGCVLLDSDGNRVAEGWHRGAGTPHAEVDALADLGGRSAAGLTAVVTLEPCNHAGVTGPCTEALRAAGVGRVVYAVADPGAESGGGAHALRAAGIEVTAG